MDLMLLAMGVAVAVWMLTSKKTRGSVGDTTQETALYVHQKMAIVRQQDLTEAQAEGLNQAQLETNKKFEALLFAKSE